MTSIPVDRIGAQLRDARQAVATMFGWVLFGAGWIVAKACRLSLTSLTALLFGAGWLAGKAVWPALVWASTSVRLGWDEGRKPIGGRRGPA